MSGPIKFQLFNLFGKAIRELCFAQIPIKIGLRVPNRQFCPDDNNKIQKELHTIIRCIQKFIFPTYDSFRLITSQILRQVVLVEDPAAFVFNIKQLKRLWLVVLFRGPIYIEQDRHATSKERCGHHDSGFKVNTLHWKVFLPPSSTGLFVFFFLFFFFVRGENIQILNFVHDMSFCQKVNS